MLFDLHKKNAHISPLRPNCLFIALLVLYFVVIPFKYF